MLLLNFRTYGAAGHGKGTTDAMPSFEVKNVLRRDIVTLDIFFDTSEEIVDYLHIKNPSLLLCFHQIWTAASEKTRL